MLVMVVAGYRLSWSCMQLAYVSDGSFIFKAADPCRLFPGQRDGSPNLEAKEAQQRQRCLKKSLDMVSVSAALGM